MSGVVRPSAISFGRAARARRPGGDFLRRRQHAARPFQAGTDPDVLWLGRAQQQILDRLESGVLAREGVLLLTGDVGTGKTILAKALLERLRADTLIATVTYAQYDPLDFWKGIGDAWGAGDSPATPEAHYGRLPALLDDAAAQDKRVLLFVDEAQALSQVLLTEIGRLAVMAQEPGHRQARLSILLVGQDELEAVLSRPQNTTLAKRVGVRCKTVPLTDAEVHAYVAHQLKLAGTEEPVFTEAGLQELATTSQGIPRLVNTIADLALLSSSQQGAPTIGAEVVRQCARRLGQPLSLADRLEPRRAKAPARMPRARRSRRRVALYLPVLVLLLAGVGYLYGSARHRDPRREPGESASAALSLDRPASGGMSGPVQSTRAGDAASAAPPNPELPPPVPARPAILQRPEPQAGASPEAPPAPVIRRPAPGPQLSQPQVEAPPQAPPAPVVRRPAPVPQPSEPQAAASPLAPPAPVVRQPAPAVTHAPEAQRESAAARVPAAVQNREAVTAPPAGSAPRPREVRGSDTSEAVDPGGIIDWLLSEYPARRQ